MENKNIKQLHKRVDVGKINRFFMFSKKHQRRIVESMIKVFLFVILLFVGVIIMYPIFNMLSVGLRPVEQMSDPMVVWIPRSLTLENIKTAWDSMNYGTAAINSLVIALGASLLTLLSCSLAGYGFARYKFKGINLLFSLVIFTIIVPPQTTLIPKYLQFWQFDFFGLGRIIKFLTGQLFSVNLLGTYFTMFIPAVFGMGIRGGLFIYIFRQFFKGMPKELEEAAYIDGCGAFKNFFYIMLPNAKGAYLTVFIFSIVWYWNDYINNQIISYNNWNTY